MCKNSDLTARGVRAAGFPKYILVISDGVLGVLLAGDLLASRPPRDHQEQIETQRGYHEVVENRQSDPTKKRVDDLDPSTIAHIVWEHFRCDGSQRSRNVRLLTIVAICMSCIFVGPLHPKVQAELDYLYTNGFLTKPEVKRTLVERLATLPTNDALDALRKFSDHEWNRTQNRLVANVMRSQAQKVYLLLNVSSP